MEFKGLELFAPETFEHMKSVAKTIFESGRCQRQWLPNAQSVLVCMQKATDLGIPPLQGLDHLCQFRDKGRWAVSFDLAKALVAAKGGTMTILVDTEQEVKILVTRPEWKDHTETVLMSEIKKSGIDQGKDTWAKYPKAMLRATALRRGLTHVWADVLIGCSPIDPELETEQPEEVDLGSITEEDHKPRRVRRTKAEMEQAALADMAPPHQADEEQQKGIEISTPLEPVVIPPKLEILTPEQVTGIKTAKEKAEEFRKMVSAPIAPPPVEEPKKEACEAFDIGKLPHRLILIEAIKQTGLSPDQIKHCKTEWAANKWPAANGVSAELESIKAGLKECCNEIVTK